MNYQLKAHGLVFDTNDVEELRSILGVLERGAMGLNARPAPRTLREAVQLSRIPRPSKRDATLALAPRKRRARRKPVRSGRTAGAVAPPERSMKRAVKKAAPKRTPAPRLAAKKPRPAPKSAPAPAGAYTPRPCKKCGAKFQKTGPRSLYCPKCKPKPHKGAATKATTRVELTPEERKAMSGPTPALICQPPFGCGKAFQSDIPKAKYCVPCTAKRDAGRAA